MPEIWFCSFLTYLAFCHVGYFSPLITAGKANTARYLIFRSSPIMILTIIETHNKQTIFYYVMIKGLIPGNISWFLSLLGAIRTVLSERGQTEEKLAYLWMVNLNSLSGFLVLHCLFRHLHIRRCFVPTWQSTHLRAQSWSVIFQFSRSNSFCSFR